MGSLNIQLKIFLQYMRGMKSGTDIKMQKVLLELVT